MDPADVAADVAYAVKANRFWIITHQVTQERLKARNRPRGGPQAAPARRPVTLSRPRRSLPCSSIPVTEGTLRWLNDPHANPGYGTPNFAMISRWFQLPLSRTPRSGP